MKKTDDDKTVLKIDKSDDDEKTILANTAGTDADANTDSTVLAPTEKKLPNEKNRLAPSEDDKTRLQSSTDTELADTSEAATVISSEAPPPTRKYTKLEPGSIINNRFVLEKLLGRGGMGSVFKARDLRKEEANDSNSHIAIKFLNEDFKQHPQALISLQREAKKSQTLAHPNIITVHDFDRDGDTVYMTMEYLDGAPLDEYLLNHKHTGIEKDTALKILDDMSRALSYAHEKNIVHSDFKPGNIFITNDGTAKVLDFGIARAVKSAAEGTGESTRESTGKNISEDIGKNTDKNASSRTPDSSDQTMFDAGDLGGLTPTYASCEMLEGKEPSPSDDIYALGCVAYQLLNGAHPFSKLPATQARDQNLKPEIIKHLDKKQSNALLHSLQFAKEERTKDARTFILEFFIRKQSSKGLIATLAVAGLLLAGVGVKSFLDYQQKIEMSELVIQVQQGNNQVIANAIPSLKSLEGETRENVLAEVRPMVIQYYANKSLPLADQSKGKYNFPQAIAILNEAKQLYPDSAQANELIIELINSQNQLLNTLAKQIDKYLRKGKLTSAVANNDIQDIIDLLKIAAPDSHLLKDPRIQLAYIREMKTALKNDNLDDANTLLKSALSLFNDNEAFFTLILPLKNALKEREAQLIEDQQLLSLQKQLSQDGKKISNEVRQKALKRHTEKLTQLIETGFHEKTWINAVQTEIVGLDAFARKNSEKQSALRDKAATLIIQKARTTRRSNQLAEAHNLLKQASKIAPKLASLAREKRALTVAERKQRKTDANKAKTAEITTLRQTLLNQANANDVKNATKTLKTLKSIDPNSRFVKNNAPEAIANAYLRLAQGLADRENYSNAVKLAQAGIDIAPRYMQAKDKKQKYLAHIAITNLNLALTNIDNINAKETKKQLRIIKQGLPDQLDSIQTTASAKILQHIKQVAQKNPDKAKTLIDIAQAIFPANRDITALTKRSSKFQSAGGQPCKKSYAGHGKRTRATCFDMVSNSIKSPLMVVIPAISNTSPAFAISKYEVSIGEFNQYCQLSQECKIKKGDTNLPVNQVSVKKIKKYIKWVSVKTGQLYQLPTDEQWRHAAYGKGKTSTKDVNCRLMLGSKQIKGNNLLDTKSGKQNGWGLKHYVGNVQELVSRGTQYYARGGSYTDSFSQCDIDLKRKHSGKADSVTGFRILKTL